MTSSPVAGVCVEPAVLRAATIVQLMTHVPDPRHRRGRRHRLAVVLVIAVAAVTAVAAHALPLKLNIVVAIVAAIIAGLLVDHHSTRTAATADDRT